MKSGRWGSLVWIGCLLMGCTAIPVQVPEQSRLIPATGLDDSLPSIRHYLAPKRVGAIAVDGRLDDSAWAEVPWTESFVDIEGARRPPPLWSTRVKMTWDDSAFFVAAEIKEPHLWATLHDRDAVIFQDNDFEVFVDPDNDTHRYFELEINALGTVWDLFLSKPYRDEGSAVNAWDIAGLQSAVHLYGTLNDPSDRDRGWSVELAIPWKAFTDSGGIDHVPPRVGDQWRVNFSRVQWQGDPAETGYDKRRTAEGVVLDEANWVWSPQQAINMHLPEMWGVVQFADSIGASSTLVPDAERTPHWILRRIYYRERLYAAEHGAYAPTVVRLGLQVVPPGLVISGTPVSYWATIPTADGAGEWHIGPDGRLWRD